MTAIGFVDQYNQKAKEINWAHPIALVEPETPDAFQDGVVALRGSRTGFLLGMKGGSVDNIKIIDTMADQQGRFVVAVVIAMMVLAGLDKTSSNRTVKKLNLAGKKRIGGTRIRVGDYYAHVAVLSNAEHIVFSMEPRK